MTSDIQSQINSKQSILSNTAGAGLPVLDEPNNKLRRIIVDYPSQAVVDLDESILLDIDLTDYYRSDQVDAGFNSRSFLDTKILRILHKN